MDEDQIHSLNEHLAQFDYRRDLTGLLDALPAGEPIDQAKINQIVLWKVNRYAEPSAQAVVALNTVGNVAPRKHRHAPSARNALEALLACRGIDLAMASTLMRFRNPTAFQIIDQRAYRATYNMPLPARRWHTSESKIELYFDYLDQLWEIASSPSCPVQFSDLDRALYMYDRAGHRNVALR